jgi:hypothetical protein
VGRVRQYSQAPFDDSLGQQTKDWQDWVTTALNTLVGQNLTLQQGFNALSSPQVNPSTSQVQSLGSRVASLTTNFGAAAPSTTSITLYWDGTNNSTILRIYRDDGTVAGPFPGSQTITGLVAATTYFFYPYFDEATQKVLFVSIPPAVGSPPIAYTAATIAVAQQQILRGRIPLAANLSVTGFATPAAGSTPAASQGGGGGSGGSFLGSRLTQ